MCHLAKTTIKTLARYVFTFSYMPTSCICYMMFPMHTLFSENCENSLNYDDWSTMQDEMYILK